MQNSNDVPTITRRATHEDVERILDLLTEYGLPRSYFEPFYLNDTTYRPEHSWVVERNGRLISHVRVYDRWMRIGRAKLRIAGIGNVITAPDSRKQGYAARLLRTILPELQKEGFAYSLLWTDRPNVYSRNGWAPIEQEQVRAVLAPSILGSVSIAPFQHDDLSAIMRLYEVANAERTGTTIRTLAYWQEQPTWLHEDADSFLVAKDIGEEVPVGYVRSRATQNAVEILDLAFEGGGFDVGRALLAATSMQRDGQLRCQFPPSLRAMFQPSEFEVVPGSMLMGRTINLSELLRTLEPLWRDRVQESGSKGGFVRLATSTGHAEIRVSNGNVEIELTSGEGAMLALSEGEFAHLLFHGFDAAANNRIGNRLNAALLPALFPEQDFVIWQADVF